MELFEDVYEPQLSKTLNVLTIDAPTSTFIIIFISARQFRGLLALEYITDMPFCLISCKVFGRQIFND